MLTLCINPVSACAQCSSAADVGRAVKHLVDCFERLLPMIQKERAKLVYDSRIEGRYLRGSDVFLSSINSIPNDEAHQDVKRLWFTYTKNRAEDQRTEPPLEVTVSSPEVVDTTLAGEVSSEWMKNGHHWLSFGGNSLTEAKTLHVSHSEGQYNAFRNAHDLPSLMLTLPRYEASPKHHLEAYMTEDGEFVSAMPLQSVEAQSLLLLSVKEATDRWAYHGGLRAYFRFKVTSAQFDIYHGFQVEENDVPGHIREQLRD